MCGGRLFVYGGSICAGLEKSCLCVLLCYLEIFGSLPGIIKTQGGYILQKGA